MAAIRLKTKVKIGVKAKCPSHSRSNITARDTTTIIDEPPERGGTNAGPAPTETALAALAGCTNVIGHKCAAKLGINISNVTVDVTADFDRLGVTLQEEIDVPFEKIQLRVELDSDASQEEIDRLAVEVGKFCPLSKLFVQAGTEVSEEWVVRQPD
ncbi:MAG: OsmC family protein [Hyphomicrobiales bacterium]